MPKYLLTSEYVSFDMAPNILNNILFAYLAWNAYSGPKIGLSGDFGPLNVIIHYRNPQKAHPCVNPRLLSYQL